MPLSSRMNDGSILSLQARGFTAICTRDNSKLGLKYNDVCCQLHSLTL